MTTVIRALILSALLAAQILAQPSGASAQGQEAAPQGTERKHLLGDLGGARSSLAAHGIIVDYHATNFYQGVVDGSPGTSDWQYGFKGDLLVNIIGEKLGLWPGLFLSLHLETRAGEDVNGLSGLSPANAAMVMPEEDSVTALTQVSAIQMLGEQFAVTVGKVNAIDFVDSLLHTGRGIDGFMNMSLVLPLGLGRTAPVVMPAAGFMKFKGKEVQGVAVVYDPNACPTTSCLDPFFEDSAVLGLWKFFTGNGQASGREGYIALGGTYSFKDYLVVAPGDLFINPAEGLIGFTDTQHSWSVVSIVDQPLWTDPSDPDRNVRFKGMYTYTDGEANPIHWTATAALEANGPFRSRDDDVFGVAYFHNELASGFKDIVGPLLSAVETFVTGVPTRITVEDTEGFEAYYKAQITPWFALTGDVQVITETLSNFDTKVITGVRGKVTF